MENQKKIKKVVIAKEERTFGDMIGVPFAFLFQEFRGLILAILKYAGPIFALAIFLGFIFFGDYFNNLPLQGRMSSPTNPGLSVIFVIIIFSIAIYTVVAVVFNYISAYERFGKGNFTIKDVGSGLFIIILKIFGGAFLMGLIFIPIVFLIAIPVVGPILYFVLLSYLSVNLSLFPFIIAHEKLGIGTAFSRSFKLIKGSWWFSFGLYIVFFIIIYFTMYMAMIPMILVGVATSLTGASSGAGIVVMIILFVILIFFIYIMLITAMNILFSFQYFNMLVKKEGAGLTERISAINDGNDNDTNVFEIKEEENDTTSEEILKKEEDNNIYAPKDKTKPKTEGEWDKLLDETQKKNRFEEDDENDRFKPKY